MPSDFSAISQTQCVGCGRPSITVSESGVVLKPLETYSRAFGCVTCWAKYSKCANCQHDRHRSIVTLITSFRELRRKQGKCWCGCSEYRHGLAAEFDRQYSTATGRAPMQAKCHHCGNWFNLKAGTFSLCCERCAEDRRALDA